MLETPVVLITYKRPDTTRRLLERIAAARPRILYVASDGPRDASEEQAVLATRALFDRLDWECEVHRDFADRNLGLALRVTSALTRAFQTVDELIVLEDDTLPDPTFFVFCAELLERYRSDERVLQIRGTCPLPNARGGSPYSYVFTQLIGTWGWATWKRAWERFDWSFFATEHARRIRTRRRPHLGHVLKPWRKVQRDPALGERVRRCGHYYRMWMRACDMRAISTSWAGVLAFGLIEQDGLVASPLTNLVSTSFEPDSVHFSEPRVATTAAGVERLGLPLRHPPVVALETDYQRRFARAVDRGFLGKRRLDGAIGPVSPSAAGTDLSVIVACEGVKPERRLLERLSAELTEVPGGRALEVVFALDASAGDLSTVEARVGALLEPREPRLAVRFVSATRIEGSALRNLGAREALGDLLLFLDGDAVPEPGWLREILEPFSDPKTQLVSGHTSIEPRGILAKTLGREWFFPAEAVFMPSNLAFRRKLFERSLFPPGSVSARGACLNLLERLDREGIVGRVERAARVVHPPPAGLLRCLARGLVQGREVLRQREDDAHHVVTGWSLPDAWISVAGQGLRGLRELVVEPERVGLARAALPLAVSISAAFTFARLTGVGLERLRRMVSTQAGRRAW